MKGKSGMEKRVATVLFIAFCVAALCAGGAVAEGAAMSARDIFGIAVDEPFPKYREPESKEGMARVEARGGEMWLKCFGPFRPYSVSERTDSGRDDLMGEMLVGRVDGRTVPLRQAEARRVFSEICARFDKAGNLSRGGRFDFEKWGEYSASWIGTEENGVPFLIELDCNAAAAGERTCPALLTVSEFEHLRERFRTPETECFGIELGTPSTAVKGLASTLQKAGTNRLDVSKLQHIKGRWKAMSIETHAGRIIAVEGRPGGAVEESAAVEGEREKIVRAALAALSPKLAERFKGISPGRAISAEYMARNGHLCRLRIKPLQATGGGGSHPAGVSVRFEDLTPSRPPLVAKDRDGRLKKAKAAELERRNAMMRTGRYEGQWEGNANGRMWLVFDPDGVGIMRIGGAMVWFRWTADDKGHITAKVSFTDGTSFDFAVRYQSACDGMELDTNNNHIAALAAGGDGRGDSSCGLLAFKSHLKTSDLIVGPRPSNLDNIPVKSLAGVEPGERKDGSRPVDSWDSLAKILASLEDGECCSLCAASLPFADFRRMGPDEMSVIYICGVGSGGTMTLPTHTAGDREWPDWNAVKGKSVPKENVARFLERMKNLDCDAQEIETGGEGALAGYMVSGPDVAFSGENLARTLGADVRLPVTALLTK